MANDARLRGAPDQGASYHPLYQHWRNLIHEAYNQYGGIQWQPRRLIPIHEDAQTALAKYVSYPHPSPFKKVAAFAVAFMDPSNYPIFGEFANHKLATRFQQTPRWSGAFLVYEYIRYSLDHASLNRNGDKNPTILSNPIKVSEHTFVDIIQAITHISKDHSADFHLTSLLFEQLAYLENPGASYDRNV